jgi:hypothetical protein
MQLLGRTIRNDGVELHENLLILVNDTSFLLNIEKLVTLFT